MDITTDTTRTTRRARAFVATAAAVLLLPGLLVACSSAAPTGDETTAAAGGASKGSSLASCMRDEGYDMPDPDGSGSTMQLSAPEGVDPEQYQADLKRCLDAGTGAGDAAMAQPMPGGDERTRKTAECIREHGFSDYPDDEEAKAAWHPDDENAFDEVARSCQAQAAGDSTDKVRP